MSSGAAEAEEDAAEGAAVAEAEDEDGDASADRFAALDGEPDMEGGERGSAGDNQARAAAESGGAESSARSERHRAAEGCCFSRECRALCRSVHTVGSRCAQCEVQQHVPRVNATEQAGIESRRSFV